LFSLVSAEIIWQIQHGLVDVCRPNRPITRMDAGFHGVLGVAEEVPISDGFSWLFKLFSAL
jgi:hypothetical protein